MSSSSFNFPSLQGTLLSKSHFIGQTLLHISSSLIIHKPLLLPPPTFSRLYVSAKFNLSEIMGGRGLCNGEQGLQQELKKTVSQEPWSSSDTNNQQKPAPSTVESIPENGFEKELLGLTGGFPGGEKGLQKFIEQNPPPPKGSSSSASPIVVGFNQRLAKKLKQPELPLLMPGMIAIVKNPNNPFYMYCGIVQRITDGKAGVLFEGGNWDKLITFRLDELERREKGPPMVSPRSVVLEPPIIEKDS